LNIARRIDSAERTSDAGTAVPGKAGFLASPCSWRCCAVRASSPPRHGTTVVYALAGGDVAELMRAARRILTEMLAGQNQLLAELRESLTEPA
jgi:hypothetical protein